MNGCTIRQAIPEDAEAIASIYAYHVLNGTASYDVDPPPASEIRAKIERINAAGWPFIVAESEGHLIGYAYATQFRDRAAYRFTAEDSIYVDPHSMGRGVGKRLLDALIDRCRAYGFLQLVAVIGGAEPASIALHSKCGFHHAGKLTAVGFKKERWLDSVYMQLELAKAPG